VLKRTKIKGGYVFTLRVESYDARVDIVIGDNMIDVQEDYINFLNKNGLKVLDEQDDPFDHTDAGGVYYYETNTGIIHVLFTTFSDLQDVLLVHENFHLTCAILRRRGINLSQQTEESYAYLNEHLYSVLIQISNKAKELYAIQNLGKRHKGG
jgi:hypothetical protein